MAKISKEKWKVWGNVFDEFTLRTLFKLSSQGHFDYLQSPIFIGKESNTFTAVKDDKRIVVKIYRLETCDFNKMYTYIRTDPRYKNLKRQKRKIVFAWTLREYRNLLKAREAGVKCPMPLGFSNNVILLELIGDDDGLALRMKDDPPKDMKNFCDKIIDNMKKLHKAGLVHGDLSEYNILNYKDLPVFIDFSQCSSIEDPNALEYIARDVKNITRFFKKRGMDIDADELKQKINKQLKKKA